MFPMYPKSHHTDIDIVPILYFTRNLLSVLKWTIKQIVFITRYSEKRSHVYYVILCYGICILIFVRATLAEWQNTPIPLGAPIVATKETLYR